MQTGIKALKLIARLKQQQLDERLLVQHHGLTSEEPSTDQMLRMLKKLGYVARQKKLTLAKYPANYPLPALLIRQDGGYDVLVKVNVLQKTVTIFDCLAGRLDTRPMADYQPLLKPVVVVLNYRKFPVQIPFGFQWFWQELAHHRLVMLEVLLGSFVVQAFGLITPLCTQLILDKVLVHRSESTLFVISVAFLAIMVFEFLINLARNSIFTHSANQLDAKLGAKLFRYLFALPYAYFERRQTGTIITRVKELDTIREFLTNKCVSVVIDSVFALVFLVVMLVYSVPLTLVVLGFLAVISLIYAVITPAQKLLSIIPDHTPLQAQLLVDNKDIGFVKPNDTVALKLDAYEFQKYGTMQGKVSHIAANSRDVPQPPSASNVTGGTVVGSPAQPTAPTTISGFEVWVSTQPTLAKPHQSIRLKPGYGVTVDITVGKRRIIDFLLYPMTKHWQEGLSVR